MTPSPLHDDIAAATTAVPLGGNGKEMSKSNDNRGDDDLATLQVSEMIASRWHSAGEEEEDDDADEDEEFGDGSPINHFPSFSPDGKFTNYETRGEDPEMQELATNSSDNDEGEGATRPTRKRYNRKYAVFFWVLLIFDAIILAGFLAYGRMKDEQSTLAAAAASPPLKPAGFQNSVPVAEEDATTTALVPTAAPTVANTPKPTHHRHKHDHDPTSTPTATPTSRPTSKPTHRKHTHPIVHHDGHGPHHGNGHHHKQTNKPTAAPTSSPTSSPTLKPTHHNHHNGKHHTEKEEEQDEVVEVPSTPDVITVVKTNVTTNVAVDATPITSAPTKSPIKSPSTESPTPHHKETIAESIVGAFDTLTESAEYFGP
jgi:hypothetical protein